MIRFVLTIVAVAIWGGSVTAGDFKLYIKGGVIKSKKAGGADWDALGGKPDAFVEASILGERQAVVATKNSSTKQNTLKPDWNESVLEVNIGDEIRIRIYDEDLQVNDLIGEYSFTVTKQMVGSGDQSTSFGQVESFTYSVKPK
jgi:Ca2+-dependent lipid-binding protein